MLETFPKDTCRYITYLGLIPLGGGCDGPVFLFLAEQTEHDSSEQLLTDDPEPDDYRTNNIICFLYVVSQVADLVYEKPVC